jgi:hypothetical protein
VSPLRVRAYRTYKATRAAAELTKNIALNEEGRGPHDQDELGDYGEIGDHELADDERQLQESIAQPVREQQRHPRGSWNGERKDRENDRQWRNHQKRIDEEQDRLKEITRRLDEIERKRS